MADIDPIVGNWYKNLETGTNFEVVAVDEYFQTVEVQHFDGEVEEWELDIWCEMVLEAIEPPKDWSGPFDDLEPDDLGYGDDPKTGEQEDPFRNLY